MNDEPTLPDRDTAPISREEIEQLFAAGLIPPEAKREIFSAFRKEVDWSGWLRHWLEALGAIFLMAGVLFFFAHNWSKMSPILRFSVLEGAIIIVTASAILAGIQKSAGQWLLSGGCVLTGILIAVYGQIYQTGADAFEIFALWSGLILIWVIAAKFAPLWAFWLVVTETAMILFGGQVIVPDGAATWTTVFLGLGIFTIASLVVFESLESKDRFEWLRFEWIRLMLVMASIFWLSAIPWYWIFDFGFDINQDLAIFAVGTFCWLIAVGVGFWFYSKKRASISSFSIYVLSPAIICVCWLGRILLRGVDSNSSVRWLLVGTTAIVIFTGAAWLIIYMGRKIDSQKSIQIS